MREAAAAALGQLGDTRAVEPLIAALQHNSLDISAQTVVPKIPLRAAAATALGQLGDTRAVEPLITALQISEMNETTLEQADDFNYKLADLPRPRSPAQGKGEPLGAPGG
jgi:HEAT repeat protein